MALAQARIVADLIEERGQPVELVEIVTAGDRGATAREPGGLKELFVGEINTALHAGEIDLAVHSAKDLPAVDPEGIITAAVPEREDPFDVLVTRDEGELGPGARIGTSSLRRAGQVRRLLGSIEIVPMRGNVDTRLAKLDSGEVDGVMLAAAGLARLGLEPPHVRRFTAEEMLPAPGQGAIAVQVREGDRVTRDIVWQFDHEDTHDAIVAERRVMYELGGGCSMPLGAYAQVRKPDGTARIELRIAEKEGSSWDGNTVELLPRVIDLHAVVFDPEPDPASGESVWASAHVTEEHAWHAGVAAAEALLEVGAAEVLSRLGLQPR